MKVSGCQVESVQAVLDDSQYKIKEANALFRRGDYGGALTLYLDVAMKDACLSPVVRFNIELCCRRLANSSLAEYSGHPLFFRYGHGYSVAHGAIVFESVSPRFVRKLSNPAARKPKKEDTRLKVVFVADVNPASSPERKVWGAETSAAFVMNYGRSLGFDVSEVDPTQWDEEEIISADLLVLRSIERLAAEQFQFLKTVLFEGLKPYVTYQHDYSFCRFRNSIKCGGVLRERGCSECLCPTERFFDGQASFFADVLNRASLNIFISHPQRHIFGEALGAAIDPSIVILPPVDPEAFKPVDVPRDPKLVVNTSGKLNSPNKGFLNIAAYIDQHPEFNYELYTESNAEIRAFANSRKNVSLMKPVYNTDLPFVYSRAGSLLVMPSVMEPAGRTPVEAALCGCQVISNDRLGVGYFRLPLGDRNTLEGLIYRSLDSLWGKLFSIATGDCSYG